MSLPGLDERACGLLLHPTSLPGPGASGDLGPAAARFLDFLAAAGQRWWQMLPVAPTGYGDSPYSALSAFAGNPELISVDRLIDDGLLRERPPGRDAALRTAFAALQRLPPSRRASLDEFCQAQRDWLEDFALYRALKRAHGERAWTAWPAELRDRQPAALASARQRLADEIALCRFEQHRFDLDWQALRRRAGERGVALMGDLPIFVAHDSADVWQHRELFRLRPDGDPEVVAGVPPDYFSATGQRWGNPLYRWRVMAKDGYRWWLARLRAELARFDAVRLDHFIGFVRYWEIPAHEPTAVRGRWMKGPGANFFLAARAALGRLPLVAEDLGAVTPAVTALAQRFGFPGLRILQFAFGTDPQAAVFKPHGYQRSCVAYTGTHDNDTTVGWFQDPALPEKERRAALRYLGLASDGPAREVPWAMMRVLYMSVANLVIVPVQDALVLGTEARMNRPGLALGNWRFRLAEGALDEALALRLRGLADTYERV